MMNKVIIAAMLCIASVYAVAQPGSSMKTVQSIGAGPFEFPITGTFSFNREGAATVLKTSNNEKQITVAFFRKNAVLASPNTVEEILSVENIVRRSWERFAIQEKMKMVRSFKRTDIASRLTMFSMATEYIEQAKVQYYVQFAVTDGAQTASLIFEGSGSAEAAAAEYEPIVMRVNLTNASNSSPQEDAQKAARP